MVPGVTALAFRYMKKLTFEEVQTLLH